MSEPGRAECANTGKFIRDCRFELVRVSEMAPPGHGRSSGAEGFAEYVQMNAV
jgi:hypothetical protein